MNQTRKKRDFIKHLKDGKGIISYACQKINICRKTYYNWISSDEKFKELCEEINEFVIDGVESKLLNKINDEDTVAIIFYLKTKGKKRGYIETTNVVETSDPWTELALKSLE